MSTALARRSLREFPPSPGRVMLRIAEMGIHLALQRTLKHDLGQPAQQAARPGQRQALGPHPLSQLPHELQIGGLSRIRLLRCRRSVPSSDAPSARLVPGITPLKLESRRHDGKVPAVNAAAARLVYISAVLASICLASGQRDVSKPGPVRKPVGAIWPASPPPMLSRAHSATARPWRAAP